jgi:hypothetical protein
VRNIDKATIERIGRDPIFRLLLINMALVILGYALGVLTGLASVAPMRILKYTVLLISVLIVLKLNVRILSLLTRYAQGIFVLSAALFLFALFTSSPLVSIGRALTFIIPFLYVALSVGYLLIRYTIRDTLNHCLNITNWIYFLPIVSYFITGGSLTDTNIYYISVENNDTAFVSNHYGWSGTIFIVTGIDLLRNANLPTWRRLLIVIFCGISMYLVLISGNRTSWLSLLLVFMVFIVQYRRIALYQKAILALLPLGLIFYLIQDPTSALNNRINKTRVQAAKGEARASVAKTMSSYFNSNPVLWATGIGLFNSPRIKQIIGWSGYHNSYFEVLFGTGVAMFLLFCYLLLVRPLWIYLRYFAEHYLFLFPFVVIPFFESNLTGGQFLFFPWFIFVLLMSYCRPIAELKQGFTNCRTGTQTP